ncbi:MAG: hypothetical protein ACK4N1_02920 [Pseudorhizobium sp.]
MWKITLVGGIGGVLPSLMDKVQAWNSGEIQKWLETAPNFTIAIVVASVPTIVYFLIGALVAAVYESQSAQKALLIGLGAPAFIIASFNNSSPENPKILQIASILDFLAVDRAHAESALNPQIQLNLQAFSADQRCSTCVVTYLSASGEAIATESLASSQAPDVLTVPDNAKVLQFRGDDTNPAELDLRQLDASPAPDRGPTIIDVGVARSYWNDLSRAFGAKGVEPYNFSVEVEKQ